MNAPKCEATDYIDFLVAAQKVFSCTEAARVQSVDPQAPAHDALTRLLHRLEPAELEAALWAEAAPQVRLANGLLVLDDSTLDLAPKTKTSGCATKRAQPKWQRHKANTADDLTRSASARSPRWRASLAQSRNRWPAIWA